MNTKIGGVYTTLNNGISMPLLGLGVYDMYEKTAEKAVSWALETGYRLIDTAAMYKNETEIGNALKASEIPRNEVFITTKVNDIDQGYDNTLRAYDESLKKLQTDYIDLYLVHWPLKASRKETWQALEKIYASGKARAIGVANYLEPFLDELQTFSEIVPAVNQVEFSPFLYLDNLLKRCKKDKIQLQSYTPLVRGERFSDPKLILMAKKYDKTPAQVILRWNIQLGVSTIPKSATLARIKENFDIFDFEITASDMIKICDFNENYRIIDDPMLLI